MDGGGGESKVLKCESEVHKKRFARMEGYRFFFQHCVYISTVIQNMYIYTPALSSPAPTITTKNRLHPYIHSFYVTTINTAGRHISFASADGKLILFYFYLFTFFFFFLQRKPSR